MSVDPGSTHPPAAAETENLLAELGTFLPDPDVAGVVDPIRDHSGRAEED